MFQIYLEYEFWLAAAQLALAMFGMGATLRPRDFASVAEEPRSIVSGVLLQSVGVPLLAAGLLLLLPIHPGVAAGIALCAAIPGGTMSNVLTFVSRGHVALSIALTGITTLACLITTPLILQLLIAEHMSPDFVMPAAKIAREIGLVLLLPLLLGMVLLQLLPDAATTISRWSIRASLLCIVLMVIGALGSGRVDLAAFGVVNVAYVVLFVTALAFFSYILPRALRLAQPDITAINIEVTLRNANLGVMIAVSLFPAGQSEELGNMVLFTVMSFGGASLLAGIGLARMHQHMNRGTRQSYPPA